MFDYYALLRRTYRLPVVPLVIYLRGGGERLTHEEYRDGPFGMDTLTFRYDCLVLGQLDAEQHAATDEALLAGLAALMDRSKVVKRLRLRLSMLDRIGRSAYDAYRKFLLTNLVEVYFELEENEVERFERALARPEFKEAKSMATSHVDRILEEGRREGRNEGVLQGLIQGKQETLLRQLNRKFGVVSDELESEIHSIASVEATMPCSTKCSSRARSRRWTFPDQSGADSDQTIQPRKA